MAPSQLAAIFFALAVGVNSECAASDGTCTGSGPEADASTLLQAKDAQRHNAAVADPGIDWTQLRSANFENDQGQCGSSWAVSAVSCLEMHVEITKQEVRRLSRQQVIDCAERNSCGVPPPEACTESPNMFALNYIQKEPLALESEYPYDATQAGHCRRNHFKPASMSTASFVPIIPNSADDLLIALNDLGPVLVSVAAESWTSYSFGIHKLCGSTDEINHSAIVVGYGEDGDRKYWNIRNSWGKAFGENGNIRLARGIHEGIDEDVQCSERETFKPSRPFPDDTCFDEPSTIRACGMCGILSKPMRPHL